MNSVQLLFARVSRLLKPALTDLAEMVSAWSGISKTSKLGVFLYDFLASSVYVGSAFLFAVVYVYQAAAFNPVVVTLLMFISFIGMRSALVKGIWVFAYSVALTALLSVAIGSLLVNKSFGSGVAFSLLAMLAIPLIGNRSRTTKVLGITLLLGYSAWALRSIGFSIKDQPEVLSSFLLLLILVCVSAYAYFIGIKVRQKRIADLKEKMAGLEEEVATLRAKLQASEKAFVHLAKSQPAPENKSTAPTPAELGQAQIDALVATDKLATLGAMVAGVAHEMASPMSVALLMSQTIIDKLKTYQTAMAEGNTVVSQRSMAAITDSSEIILRNIRNTSELLASFKTVSVDRASERRRSFDVAKEIKNIVHSIRAANRRNEIEVVVSIGDGQFVDGYPGRFGQIVTNLINNAYIHGHPFPLVQGYIRISKDVHRSTSSVFAITVTDSGIGVPVKQQANLFKPFHTTAIERGGSGLGLAISRHLAREIGGDLVFLPEATPGATFLLTFPVTAPNLAKTEQ